MADLPSRNATDTLLFRMVEAGEISRVAKGMYGPMEADAEDEPRMQKDPKMDWVSEASA